MTKLLVIVGSTRPGRVADLVPPWVIDRVQNHGAFDVEVLNLPDWPLPIFAESFETVGDFNDPTNSTPLVRSEPKATFLQRRFESKQRPRVSTRWKTLWVRARRVSLFSPDESNKELI
jgi:hypothetical protein